jgi:hypothetical protein
VKVTRHAQALRALAGKDRCEAHCFRDTRKSSEMLTDWAPAVSIACAAPVPRAQAHRRSLPGR